MQVPYSRDYVPYLRSLLVDTPEGYIEYMYVSERRVPSGVWRAPRPAQIAPRLCMSYVDYGYVRAKVPA